MSHPSPACWLAVVPAFLAMVAAADPVPAAPALSAVPAASAPAFRSAFEGYRPHADDPPIPWRQANETVRERGGWKAYAREAERPSAAGAGSTGSAAHSGHMRPAAEGQP